MKLITGKNNRKKKRLIALVMSLLMLTTLITTGRFEPKADAGSPESFLQFVNSVAVSPESTNTAPVKMDSAFAISMTFQLPADTDDWKLAEHTLYSFSLSEFIAKDASNNEIDNFISTTNKTNQPIYKGEDIVGYYNIVGNDVTLDFSYGINHGLLVGESNRNGGFNFSCGLDESKFNDEGGEYKLSFKTVTNPPETTVYLDRKTSVDKGVKIAKAGSAYDAATGKITYTLTVSNANSTPITGLEIKDTTGNNLTLDTASVQGNGVTVNSVEAEQYNAHNVTMNVDIPANTTDATITYTCSLSEGAFFSNNNVSGNQWNGTDNTISAKLDGQNIYIDTGKITQKVTTPIKKDMVTKTGTNNGDGTITWKIVVNDGETPYSLAGVTIADTLGSNLGAISEVNVSPANTNLAAAIAGTNWTYTFPNTVDTKTYTITYKTTATPAGGRTDYINSVVVNKDDFHDDATGKVTIGNTIAKKEYTGSTGDDATPPIKNPGTSITTAPDASLNTDGQLLLPWKITANVPSDASEFIIYDHVDKYDKGLAYDTGSLVINVEGTALTADTDYTVAYNTGSYNNEINMTITFTSEGLGKIKGKTLTATYNTIGDYKDRTVNDNNDYYANHATVTYDPSKSEKVDASVNYKFKKPDTGSKVEKYADTKDDDKGIIGWKIVVGKDATDVKLVDKCDTMTYYGYSRWQSDYVYDNDTNHIYALAFTSDGRYEIKLSYDSTKKEYTTELKPENIRNIYGGSFGDISSLNGLLVETTDVDGITKHYELKKEVEIYYQTQIAGNYAKYNNNTEHSNTVTMTYNEKPAGDTDTAKETVDYKILSKQADAHSDKDGASGITYTLNVNPKGEKLNPKAEQNYYEVEDMLSSDLILRPDSIIISDGTNKYTPVASLDELVAGTYYATYIDNVISFFVPDEKALSISYTVSMLNNSVYGSKTFYNTAKIPQPYVEIQSIDENSESRNITASDAYVSDDKFIVKKIDATTLKNLEGAEFTVEEYVYDSSTHTWGADPNKTYVGVTNVNGILTDSDVKSSTNEGLNITKNYMYKIYESKAPDGYQKTDKYYKIIFPDSTLDKSYIPTDAYPITEGTTLTFSDIPSLEDNKLVITKKYYQADGTTEVDTYPATKAEIQIFNADLTLDQCKSGSYTPIALGTTSSGFKYEEAYDAATKSHVITLTKIPDGTYTVYEKSAPTGYDVLNRVYKFTVVDQKIKWDNTGDAKMSQTGDLKNTQLIDNKFTINKYYFSPSKGNSGLSAAIGTLNASNMATFTYKKTHYYDGSAYQPYTDTEHEMNKNQLGTEYWVEDLQPGKYEIDELSSELYKANNVFPIVVTVDANGEIAAVDKQGTDIANINVGDDKATSFKMNALNVFNENKLTIKKTYYDANGVQLKVPANADKAIFTLYKVGSTDPAKDGVDYQTYNRVDDTTDATTGFDEYIWTNIEPGTYVIKETIPANVSVKYEPFTDITIVVSDDYKISVNSNAKTYDASAEVKNKEINNDQKPARFYITKQIADQNGVLTNVTSGALAAGISFGIMKEGSTAGTYDVPVTKPDPDNSGSTIPNSIVFNDTTDRFEIFELTSGKYCITEANTNGGYTGNVPKIYLTITTDSNNIARITEITYDGITASDINISSIAELESGGYTETMVVNLINRPAENSITVNKTYYQPDGTTPIANQSNKAVFTLYKVVGGVETQIGTGTVTGDSYAFSKLEPLPTGTDYYVIKETTVPEGFIKSADIKFKVNADYTITIVDSPAASATELAYTINTNDANDVVASASNKVNNEFVFTKLYRDANNNAVTPTYDMNSATTFECNMVKDANGDAITSVPVPVTSTDNVYTVSNLNDGTYEIKETATAAGYRLPAATTVITLVVSNGKITASYNGDSQDFTGLYNNGKYSVSANLINREKTNEITITKKYTDANGMDIPYNKLNTYASFSLTKDGNTVTVPTQFNPSTGSYKFMNLPAGTYVIKETAPSGFEPQADITFVVSADKTITATIPAGSTWIVDNGDNTEDIEISVTNKQYKNSLTINKRFLDASGNNDSSQTAQFKLVTSTGTTAYTLTKNATTGLYEINNIDAGTYELVEIAPDGYKKVDGTITVTVGFDRKISISYTGNAGSDYNVYANNNYDAAIGLVNRKISNSIKITKKYYAPDGTTEITKSTMSNDEFATFTLQKFDTSWVNITDNNVVSSNKTQGEYTFANLEPGNYRIVETPGAGFNSISTVYFVVDAGHNISITSGATGVTGDSYNKSFTLKNTRKPYDNKVTIDKKFYYPGDVEITEDVESLLSQVSFKLYKADGTLVGELTRAANSSKYECSNLEPGVYKIKEERSLNGYEDITGKEITVQVEKRASGKSEVYVSYNGNTKDYSLTGTQDKKTLTLINRQELDNSFEINKSYVNANGLVTDPTELAELYSVTSFKLVDDNDPTNEINILAGQPVGTYKFKNIPVGSYTVVESIPDEYGYTASGSIKIVVDVTGKITATFTGVDYDFASTNNETTAVEVDLTNRSKDLCVSINKLDEEDDPLDGAELTILKPNGDELFTWTTDGTTKALPLADFYPDDVYTLKEISAPYGYEKAEEILFKVDINGQLYVKNGENFVAKADKIIDVVDKSMKIKFVKQDASNGNMLAGAKFAITDEDGNVVASWTSTKEAYEIPTIQFVPNDEYVLTEVIAPFGYEFTDKITFKVNDSGIILIKQKDGNFKLMTAEEFIIQDDPTYVCISKVDLTTGEKLVGAKLTVADAATGKEIIDTWISTDDVHNILMNKFKPGVWYTLEENQAPLGYDIAESITFMIDENGDIFFMVDGKAVPATDSLIIMKDKFTDTSSQIKTGDTTPIKPMFMLAILSMLGMLFIAFRKRYR